MTFVAKPMFPGDLHEVAGRLAREAGEKLVNVTDPAAACSIYGSAWKQAAELGWCGVLIPEDDGGAGGTLRDVSALAEAASCHAVALPIANACAVAPTLLAASGRGARHSRIVSHVVEGSWRVAPARIDELLRAKRNGGGYVLDGSLHALDVTGEPTHWLLACRVEDEGDRQGASLFLVASNQPGLSRIAYQGMDGRQTADVTFVDCRVEPDCLLAQGDAVSGAIQRARVIGAALICVETVAAIGALLEEVIRYLLARVQFGTPLAKFDVLRHKVAELYVGYENLKALVRAVVRDAEVDAAGWRRKVSLAKLYAGEVGRFAAHAGIQLHGAMGMTEELLAARLARRILMAEFDYGTRTEHLELLASMRNLRSIE